MKAFWKQHGKSLRSGLLVLLVLCAVWYARPLDIYGLMGSESPEYLVVTIWPQSNFPKPVHSELSLTAGEPEMDAALARLEELRFHRNPLEVVLQFLPQGIRATEVDPENDYQIDFYAYDQHRQPLWMLRFHINGWWRGFGRERPLYVSHSQERGRELGAWLLEISQQKNTKRN